MSQVTIPIVFVYLYSHAYYYLLKLMDVLLYLHTHIYIMYEKINEVTFYNMTDTDKFVYLMKKHSKHMSQYIEIA